MTITTITITLDGTPTEVYDLGANQESLPLTWDAMAKRLFARVAERASLSQPVKVYGVRFDGEGLTVSVEMDMPARSQEGFDGALQAVGAVDHRIGSLTRLLDENW